MSLSFFLIEKIKKLKKVNFIPFFVAMTIVLLLLLFAEFYAALVVNNINEANKHNFPKISQIKKIIAKFDYDKFTTFDKAYVELKKTVRPPAGLNFQKKRPLIFFIDSYTYGAGLEEKWTLPFQISQYTKRPVYNCSVCGWGVQHILWLLRNEKDLENIKNPEYAIYLLIEDHFRRAISPFPFSDVPYSVQLYREKNGQLYEQEGIKFYHRSYLYRYLSQWLSFLMVRSPLFTEFKENLLIKYLKEEKKLLEEKYPDIKFVVLIYPSLYGKNDFFSIDDKIQKEGILTIDGREMFLKAKNREVWADESYYLPNLHPSAEMFSILVPEIANRLNL